MAKEVTRGTITLNLIQTKKTGPAQKQPCHSGADGIQGRKARIGERVKWMAFSEELMTTKRHGRGALILAQP